MQPVVKFFLIAGFLHFIVACNNSPEKNNEEKGLPADTVARIIPVEPADAMTPGAKKINPGSEECYSNDGLKSRVVIRLNYISGTELSGQLTTTEYGADNKMEGGKFTGTINGNELIIQFSETAPVIGDASEWTTKPWMFVTKLGKPILRIIFNAKDHDTGKWKETSYDFGLASCE